MGKVNAKLIRLATVLVGFGLLAVGTRLICNKRNQPAPPDRSRPASADNDFGFDESRRNPYLRGLTNSGRKPASVRKDRPSAPSPQPLLKLTITTAQLGMGVVGGKYRQVLECRGASGKPVWTVEGGELPPGLELKEGTISGSPIQAGEWRFTLVVKDKGGRSARRKYSLVVRQASAEEEWEELTIVTSELPEAFLGRDYSAEIKVRGGGPPYIWALVGGALPELLLLNKERGALYGVPRRVGTFLFTIGVGDNSGEWAEMNYSLTVRESKLEIITDALPPAVKNEDYHVQLQARGGAVPYLWEITSGRLPAGIWFDAERGLLYGNAESVESTNFMVRVKDRGGRAAEKQFRLSVEGTLLKGEEGDNFRIVTPSLAPATRGQPYLQSIETENGVSPYVWTISEGSLEPTGLYLESDSGQITGTPGEVGEYVFTVLVSDGNRETAQARYTLTISGQVVYITNTSLEVAVVNEAYWQEISVTGGTLPYSYSLDSGTLPAGLVLDQEMGAIYGTPSASYFGQGTQEFIIRVKATDQAGNYDIAEFRLVLRESAEATPSPTPATTPMPSPSPAEGETKIENLQSAASDGSVGLVWENPSSEFTRVEVRRKTGSSFENPFEGTLVYSGTGDNCLDTGLSNGTGYFYAVIAYDGEGNAGPLEDDNTVSITPAEVGLFSSNDPYADKVIGYYPLSYSGFGPTWVIASSYDDDKEKMVALQKGGKSCPDGAYSPLIGGVVGGEVAAGSCGAGRALKFASGCETRYCAGGFGGGVDGEFTVFIERNGRSVYQNGGYYLYWSEYFEEDTTVQSRAVGPPMGKGIYEGSLDVVSLQAKEYDGSSTCGGTIILQFQDNMVVNSEGDDFTIFENAFYIEYDSERRFMEPAIVSVSQDYRNWYQFPFNYVPHYYADNTVNLNNPYSYPTGFAGITAVFSYNGSPDPRDPAVSGGDSFDLSAITEKELSWIQYVRITSTGDNWLIDVNGDPVRHTHESGACSGVGSSGFDLDAICAINY